MDVDEKLTDQRAKIDAIDAQLLVLVNQRIACAKTVAEIKDAAKTDANAQIYRPEREAQIIRSLIESNQGDIAEEDLTRLFREVMSICRGAEEGLTVSVLGPVGTYSEQAVFKQFGHVINIFHQTTIEDVFRSVETGVATFGVVPVENSTEGGISNTLTCFATSPLTACGEVNLPIHHCLMSAVDSIDKIKNVAAHAQSLAQTRRWRENHLPKVETVAVASNAEAARMAQQDITQAAIAGESAAEAYGLNILAKNIEDEPDNTTRFLVISRDNRPKPSGNDKTSLMLAGKNKPGSLYHMLEPLARHGVDMTRLESRPARTEVWEYVFFVDFNGHVDDAAIKPALAELEREVALVKHLGSYPKAL